MLNSSNTEKAGSPPSSGGVLLPWERFLSPDDPNYLNSGGHDAGHIVRYGSLMGVFGGDIDAMLTQYDMSDCDASEAVEDASRRASGVLEAVALYQAKNVAVGGIMPLFDGFGALVLSCPSSADNGPLNSVKPEVGSSNNVDAMSFKILSLALNRYFERECDQDNACVQQVLGVNEFWIYRQIQESAILESFGGDIPTGGFRTVFAGSDLSTLQLGEVK